MDKALVERFERLLDRWEKALDASEEHQRRYAEAFKEFENRSKKAYALSDRAGILSFVIFVLVLLAVLLLRN